VKKIIEKTKEGNAQIREETCVDRKWQKNKREFSHPSRHRW
jgi:hypothetical protein